MSRLLLYRLNIGRLIPHRLLMALNRTNFNCRMESIHRLMITGLFFLIVLLPYPGRTKVSVNEAQSVESQVVINEIQASNNTTISDEDGDYEDWIELYNTGVDTVALGWHGLSDDEEQPFRWIIPAGTRIAPGEHLIIWASGKDRREPAGELHTNFSIAQSGEPVLLTNLQGSRIDYFPPTRIPSDISYGRYPDGAGGSPDWEPDSLYFFSTPTPGRANDQPTYNDQVSDPEFSHTGGFYDAPFYLTISSRSNAVLHYTLDGSEPTRDDPVWPDSLKISLREADENLLSFIRTNPPEASDQHAWREPEHPPFLASVVRVRAFRENAMPSQTITHTYFVSQGIDQTPTGIHDSHAPQNSSSGPFDRYPVAVVSIVTDSLHLFDHEDGIYIPGKRYEDNRYIPPWGSPYANYFYRGDEWERPASMEFFDPGEGRVLQQDIGIRIHGGMSRALPQKSLRLYARSEYGKRRFEYPFFDHPDSHPEYMNGQHQSADDSPPSYNRLILRNSGQDFYRSTTMFRDAMVQGLVNHLNMDTQAYRPAVTFINGEFWGIMNIRERYDRHYLSRTYEIDPDRIDYLTGYMSVSEGSRIHFQTYRDYLQDHDITDSTHYARIGTMLDIDNFLDYNIANIFANNQDWPGNNREYFRYQTDYVPEAGPGRDGRWRYMLIDTDYSFGHQDRWDEVEHDMLAVATGTPADGIPNPSWSTFELRTLLENQEFRHRFISRFADYLNTFLSPDYVVQHLHHYRDMIEPVMEEHIARWTFPHQLSHWQNNVDIMEHFARERSHYMRKHLMDNFDLKDTLRLTLAVDGADHGGYIKVNETAVNGHTRGVSSRPYPWSGIYFQDIPITLEAIPRKGYRFKGWYEYPDHPEPVIRVTPNEDTVATAIFKKIDTSDFEPQPHDLSEDPFVFDHWSPDSSPETYPEHMHFYYMDRPHPGLEAWVAGDVQMSYDRESGTRIIGLGDHGIAMVNSDTDADTTDFHENRLGAVVLGLNTINQGQIRVNWTSGTIQPNSRKYGLRLEYRTGDEEPFEPVLDDRNHPVVYSRNEQEGDSRRMGPVTLPEDAENQPYIQLMWRYFDMDGNTADADDQPSMLRLDDISVTTTPLDAETGPDAPSEFIIEQNYPNPFNEITILPYQLPQNGVVTVTVYSIDGRRVSQYNEGYRLAGSHAATIRMDGWASGVYIARIQVQSEEGVLRYDGTRRMTLLK